MLNADRLPLTAGEFGGHMAYHGGVLTEGEFWPYSDAGDYNVYRGQDGNIDYNDPVAVMLAGDTEVSIPDQALAADTIWHYVRRKLSACGLESESSLPCIVKINSSGEMMPAMPNNPYDVVAVPQTGGVIKVRWRYSVRNQETAPTEFRVYQALAGGSFNFASPTAVVEIPVPMSRLGIKHDYLQWSSGALVHGKTYKFCVRAYAAGTTTETINTDYAAATADSQGPESIQSIESTWTEI